MIAVRTVCFSSDERVEMPVDRFVLRLGAETKISFTCPVCGEPHTKVLTSEPVILQLLEAGVETVVRAEEAV